MSYIERKYNEKIIEIFEKDLPELESQSIKLLSKKAITVADDIAKLCAEINKKINLILKKFYPEIKNMEDKLTIKSTLKFYYDVIAKLTDFIRNVENFRKIDDKYYETIIQFFEDKNNLISGKYRSICAQELTAFYDKQSRENLERILAEKFASSQRNFFTMGSLEEELKKIGKLAGADDVKIYSTKKMHIENFDIIDNPSSIINYSVPSENEEKLKRIGKELESFLNSKGYKAAILLVELMDINSGKESLSGNIITNAKLLPSL
jgi:hypothetical protein